MPEATPRSTREFTAGPAETTDYAPYSFLAITALAVACLFALLLLVFGFGALRQGQWVIMPELLAIPVIALVLAFAARRQILNSEGTRIGLKFCNQAWWIAIIGSILYLAYLVGVYVAIRSAADNAFRNWSAAVARSNPLEPRNVDLATAFHGTLPPDKQPSVAPTDYVKLQGLAGAGLVAFRQCDLVRVAFRNKGDIQFKIGGLEEWTQKGSRLDCKLTVKVLCAEGEYGMSVAMAQLSEPGKGEPVWQIIPPGNDNTQLLRSARLNAFGDRIRDMEVSAQQFVYQYLLGTAAIRHFNAKLFDEFSVAGKNGTEALSRLEKDAVLRSAAFGVFAWNLPEPADNFDAVARKYFQPAERGDPVREEEQRKAFARVWKSGLIGGPGLALAKSPDQNSILVPVATGWEIRVPIELQTTLAASGTSARGAVVLICDDKEFLMALDKLKNEPGPLNDAKPLLAPKLPVPWRFSRIESDMKLLTTPRPGPGQDQ